MNGALLSAGRATPFGLARARNGDAIEGGDSPRARRIYVVSRRFGTPVSTRQRLPSCRADRVCDHTCDEIMGEKRAVLCPRGRQVPLLVVTTLLVGVRTELIGE